MGRVMGPMPSSASSTKACGAGLLFRFGVKTMSAPEGRLFPLREVGMAASVACARWPRQRRWGNGEPESGGIIGISIAYQGKLRDPALVPHLVGDLMTKA